MKDKKMQITYEGSSPLYYMCINDHNLWNTYHGWMIEEIAPIWEKINIPSKKAKLLRWEKDFIELQSDAFKSYTALVHLYSYLSEDKKDQMAAECNAILSSIVSKL